MNSPVRSSRSSSTAPKTLSPLSQSQSNFTKLSENPYKLRENCENISKTIRSLSQSWDIAFASEYSSAGRDKAKEHSSGDTRRNGTIRTQFEIQPGESIDEFVQRTNSITSPLKTCENRSPRKTPEKVNTQFEILPGESIAEFVKRTESVFPNKKKEKHGKSKNMWGSFARSVFYSVKYRVNAPARFSEGVVLQGESIHTKDAFDAHVRGLSWIGYTREDVGWGCVIRSMQMLLAGIKKKLPGVSFDEETYSLSEIMRREKHQPGTFMSLAQAMGYLCKTENEDVSFYTPQCSEEKPGEKICFRSLTASSRSELFEAMADKCFVGGLMGLGYGCYCVVGFNESKNTLLYMDPHRVGETSNGEGNVFEISAEKVLNAQSHRLELAFAHSRYEALEDIFEEFIGEAGVEFGVF